MNDARLKKAVKHLVTKYRDERITGTLGRTNSDGTVTIVGSRQSYVIITLPDGTLIELPNIGRGHVPLRANLPVLIIRRHNGDLELDGYDDRLLDGDTGLPDSYGNMPHPFTSHTDVPTSYSGAAGEFVRVNDDEDALVFDDTIDGGAY